MKKLLIAFCLIPIMVLTACGGSAQTEVPQQAFLIPENLGSGWGRTVAGQTDIYTYGGIEGAYDESTGWTSFDFGDHQVFVVLNSFPNPTDEGQTYGRLFDVQWVEGSEVKKHAECWDINQYNRDVNNGNRADKEYEWGLPNDVVAEDGGGWAHDDQSRDYAYGCRFGENEADVLYLVHHHLVNSSAVQALTAFAPTATATVTPVPTATPGPGTPTAVIPTATLTNMGDIPFGCGSYARLTGTVDWNTISSLSIDCVKSIYTINFKGDDVSQLPVDFWWDQATSQLAARTKVPGCEVLGTRVICQRFFFNVSVEAPAAEIGLANVSMPANCGTVEIGGTVDWSKVASITVSCNNSRFQLNFRGQNMDRVWFYIEADQNPNYIQAYTNLLGCTVNKQKATDNNAAWAHDAKKVAMICEAYGIDLNATPR